MVGFALFNKDHFSWYLVTLIFKQRMDAIRSSKRSICSARQDIQRPSEQLQIKITGDSETLKEGPKAPESEWIVTVRKKLDLAQKDSVAGAWGKLCIYKVPQYLRVGENKAYIPNIVSIGPYHHGKEHLQNMERHKWRAFYQILKRGNQDPKLYLDTVKELEQRARSCYEGNITVSSNEFVEMMVLDGCFVLELFRGVAEGFKELGYSKSDPIFAMRGSMHSLQRDLIMLENQIPLFILVTLLRLQLDYTSQSDQVAPTVGLVAKQALQFFDPLMPTDDPLTKSHQDKREWVLTLFGHFDPLSDQTYLHCLHVFRQSLLSKGVGPQMKPRGSRAADKRRTQLIHCVTDLKEAGINFKKSKTDRFWDIRFENGVLKIPRLLIHDGTKSLFLNLIAFEQSHLDCGNEITSYVIFMDNLINSSEDVGYLHYCGIIEHWLGSDSDVADLFNQLCQEVVFDINNSYLWELSEKVNRFYDNPWNTWRANLMHNYFNTPLAIISFFAAVILLILTAGQTFYGIYGYYNPP